MPPISQHVSAHQRTNADNPSMLHRPRILVGVTTGCSPTWRCNGQAFISYGMTMIPSVLGVIPAVLALTVAAGRVVAPLAREARRFAVMWLALRGTQPSERAEIIRAFTEQTAPRSEKVIPQTGPLPSKQADAT
jgi:hypothetical protein